MKMRSVTMKSAEQMQPLIHIAVRAASLQGSVLTFVFTASVGVDEQAELASVLNKPRLDGGHVVDGNEEAPLADGEGTQSIVGQVVIKNGTQLSIVCRSMEYLMAFSDRE